MPSKEVPTYPELLTKLMVGDGDGGGKKEKKVYVPKVTGPNPQDMVMLHLPSPSHIDTLPKSKWGIPEPDMPSSFEKERDDGTYTGEIDLVLVPGVAFDKQCNRLGHGKGYYDCFLSRLFASHEEKQKPRPLTVGLALEEQMVESVPLDTFDLPLDFVVTPSRVYTRTDTHT